MVRTAYLVSLLDDYRRGLENEAEALKEATDTNGETFDLSLFIDHFNHNETQYKEILKELSK